MTWMSWRSLLRHLHQRFRLSYLLGTGEREGVFDVLTCLLGGHLVSLNDVGGVYLHLDQLIGSLE